MEAKQLSTQRPLIAAGIILGLGTGGLFDGILLHQILQWHHMLSSVRPPTTVTQMKANMVWDGFFDAATWILTLLGVFLLWRAGKQKDVFWSGKTFFGALLLGVGLFDFFEGLIDHQILGIHHVKPGTNELIWDIGFLALGAILAIAGWILIKSEEKVKS
jgi:uncharacterized membrane protein